MDANEEKTDEKEKRRQSSMWPKGSLERALKDMEADVGDFFRFRRLPVKFVHLARKFTRQLNKYGMTPREAVDLLEQRGILRVLISDRLGRYVVLERVWVELSAVDQLRFMDNLDNLYVNQKDDDE